MNNNMPNLIPKHDGYRKLKSFQVSQLVYDLTVRFCDRYINIRSRTHDQMVQAARSGVQNIAEGSQASATSKKFEIKLTQVARASLEELKLDYEDYLRHRGLPKLEPQHPVLMRFKARRCKTLEEMQNWIADERKRNTDMQRQTQANNDIETKTDSPVNVDESPCKSLSSACLAANGVLSLINLACYFLDRQVQRLTQDFENEGGFTERLYKIRTAKRNNKQ